MTESQMWYMNISNGTCIFLPVFIQIVYMEMFISALLLLTIKNLNQGFHFIFIPFAVNYEIPYHKLHLSSTTNLVQI